MATQLEREPAKNYRDVKMQAHLKSEFTGCIAYHGYCLGPLRCLTSFYLFIFDFGSQSDLLILKMPQGAGQKDGGGETKGHWRTCEKFFTP